MAMKQTKKNADAAKAKVKAALTAMVDKMVGDRVAAMAPPPAPVAKAAPRNRKEVLGEQIVKGYVGATALDPNAQEFRAKTMTAGGVATGAELAPIVFSPEVVQAFYESSVVGQIALHRYENYSSKLNIPALGKGTVRWYAEGAEATNSDDVASRTLTLESFNAVAKTGISGALIRQPGSSAPGSIGEALVKALAEDADKKLLVGAGANNEPSGIIDQLATAAKVAATITSPATKSTAAEVETDILAAIAYVRTNATVTENAAFIMPPSEALFLAGLRDAVGNKVFPEMSVANPRLLGFRVFVTTSITGVLFVEGSGLHLGIPFASGLQVAQLGNDLPSDRVTAFARAGVDIVLTNDKVGYQITSTAARWKP